MTYYSYLWGNTKLSATDAAGNGLYYLGSLVYKKQNGVLSLESTGFSGGRFIATQGSDGVIYLPTYFITDHLGSVRALVSGNGDISERNDYYPFGYRWQTLQSQVSDSRYRYNGKEEQAFVNVPYIDYGARMYDPKYRLSWGGIDQKAENYYPVGPYILCNNNPIRFEDKDGKDWKDKVVGAAIGIITNIFPTQSLRGSYNPNDADDYNNTLAVTDAIATITGDAMSESGEYAAIAGTGIAATATTATVATAGIASEVTVPALAVGKGIVLVGVSAKIGGEILKLNATKNAQNGYRYGEQSNKKVNPKRAAREREAAKRAEQPASAKYVKYKASKLEEARGKSARRKAHDAKDKIGKDRTKSEIDEDYKF